MAEVEAARVVPKQQAEVPARVDAQAGVVAPGVAAKPRVWQEVWPSSIGWGQYGTGRRRRPLTGATRRRQGRRPILAPLALAA